MDIMVKVQKTFGKRGPDIFGIDRLIREKVEQTFSNGELERIKDQIYNVTQFMANLVETLADRKILNDDDLSQLLSGGNYTVLEILNPYSKE
jgi:hypothetical protein